MVEYISSQRYEDEAWEMFRKSVGTHYTKLDLVFWFCMGIIAGFAVMPIIAMLVSRAPILGLI